MAEESLEKYLQRSSKFMRFVDGHIQGTYLGCDIVPDPFIPGKERIEYHFVDIEGMEKVFGSGSKRFARAFLKNAIGIGDTIRITRTGVGFDTDYQIEVIKRAAGTESKTPIDPAPGDPPF